MFLYCHLSSLFLRCCQHEAYLGEAAAGGKSGGRPEVACGISSAQPIFHVKIQPTDAEQSLRPEHKEWIGDSQ